MMYLASQSPRRQELLKQINIPFELLLADPSEDAEALEAYWEGESPKSYVQRVTSLKLDAANSRWKRRGLPLAPILCADTTVSLGDLLLGKPADADQAFAMLKSLADREHLVLTAVAVQAGSQRFFGLSETRVTFGPLSDLQIAQYVQTGEPFGKAGAYGVQGLAAAFVQKIDGSYSGVVGLPLFETAQLLSQAWAVLEPVPAPLG